MTADTKPDTAMPDTEHDQHAPRDPELCEELARLLGDPLPADWRDPHAIAARQDHLAATAAIAGEAALECVVAYVEAQPPSKRLDADAPGLRRFGDEMRTLFHGLRRYVHETQRSDGLQIIMEALTCSAGATVATAVDGIFDQLLREPPTSRATE